MVSKIKQSLDSYKQYVADRSDPDFTGTMVAKVTGVTFDGRQENLQRVDENTELKLERDRRNTHDFHAIKVMALVDNEWKELGFVPASMNKEIAQAMDNGLSFKAGLWKLVGGEGDFHIGLSITITRV